MMDYVGHCHYYNKDEVIKDLIIFAHIYNMEGESSTQTQSGAFSTFN